MGAGSSNPRIQQINPFVGEVATVALRQGDKFRWGLINRQGRVLVAPRFEELSPELNGRVIARTMDEIGLVDLQGRWLARFSTAGNPPYQPMHGAFIGDLVVFRVSGRHGLLDKDGKWRVEPRYTEIRRSGDGYVLHEFQGEIAAFADANGKLLFKPPELFRAKVDNGIVHADGVVSLQIDDGRYGLTDHQGRWLIQRKQDAATRRNGDLLTYLGERLVLDNENGQLIDLTGRLRSKDFRSVEPFLNGLARAGTDKGVGLIDNRLSWVLPPRYSDAQVLGPDRFNVLDDKGHWHEVDRRGQVVADQAPSLPARRREGCLYGLADAQGGWRVAPRYTDVEALPEGSSIAWYIDQAMLLDAQGKALTTPLMPRPQIREDDPRPGRFGFIDPSGRMRIGPQLWEAEDFSEGLARVSGAGFVDRDGYWVIPPTFQEARSFSEGLAAVMIGGEGWTYIDHNCRPLGEERFESAKSFHAGLARVTDKQNRTVFIDRRGQRITAPVPAATTDTSPRPLALNARWGYADSSGQWLIEPRFEDAEPFSEGLAAVKSGGRWGFVDSSGKLVIAARFAETRPMHEGWAAVAMPAAKGEPIPEWRLINRQGKLGDLSFSSAPGPFVNGLAPAQSGNFWGYIRRDGSWQIEPRFSSAEAFHDGLARITQEPQSPPVTKSGPLELPPRPRSITRLDTGLLKVGIQENRLFALLRPDGSLLIPTPLTGTRR
ncbi:WG repeat-containing protein [Uliginosibacterium sp. 31-16]|uniref:WG repeat-containing protein n=1 Tax=Uliginosibacterium sp. 31-16 TaxID=3068315 RepID=UPI00273F3751|nr:WG repeat-containing protein [Uliginosibacterium sp. 31-16]MDP5238512.1 WG repeat-containing protein [Uliginosibacterium sp. 31-16]